MKKKHAIIISKNRNSTDERYILTKDKERWLNTGLTDVKLEEYRRVENNRKFFEKTEPTEEERKATLEKIKNIKEQLFQK